MDNENKVNLFMVGAMKAGTTSITSLFANYPEVYTPPIKEPHYFIKELPANLFEPSRFFSEKAYFENDFPKPIHIAHLEQERHYKKLFSLSTDEEYRLDASTAYLHAPDTVANIHLYNPKAKIIVLRRDPLKRAFSHYKMDLGLGRINRTFEEIMVEQIEAYQNGNLGWNSYLAMSFYIKPISKYQSSFKEVLVLDFEDFIKDAKNTSKKITNFLDILDLDDLAVKHKNKTKSLRFQKVFYFLKKLGLKDYFSKIFSVKFRHRIFGMMSTKDKHPMILSESVLAQLIAIFKIESDL